jgi:hypothetical protein
MSRIDPNLQKLMKKRVLNLVKLLTLREVSYLKIQMSILPQMMTLTQTTLLLILTTTARKTMIPNQILLSPNLKRGKRKRRKREKKRKSPNLNLKSLSAIS